tara:strand:+ start:91 stop:1137 length:1047 start_codon:yes stop_codon:yes gene_type:complete
MKAKRQAKKAERKSKRAERKYDESMAYNKNLSPEARLHYLENERADKDGASMYGKGPNLEPTTMAIIKGATIAANVLPVIGPPAVKLGKKALSGLETLGAGKGFNKGFNMKNKDAFKNLSKGVGKIAKTDTGKMIKEDGLKLLDKTVKSIDGVKMSGKKKGPNAMGKKEKRSGIAGAIAGGIAGAPHLAGLGAIPGAIMGYKAGKAFGKGRDRKEAEEGAGANMMGNSISKHMGGRGANMYGEGPNATGGKLLGGSSGAATGGTLGAIFAPVTAGLSIPIGAAIGGAAGAGAGHLRDKMVEKRRNKRRAAKAGGANMEGKKPMMKGGENVIVRDAKSGGKNQYNKRGK